jgi:uncharacterized protein (TIGR02466 family)
MNYDLYFPTHIWWEDTEIDPSEMLTLCKTMIDADPKGRTLSNEGGWQSQDFRPGIYAEMKILEDAILEQAKHCVRDFGFNEEFCFPIIENFWFNVNRKYNTNMVHIHDASFVSGVYYLQAKPGQGKITMYKNSMQDFCTVSSAPISRFTAISASAISYEPLTRRLIIFPGWLPHGVSVNTLDEDRISVSFNVKLIRTDDARYWPKTS